MVNFTNNDYLLQWDSRLNFWKWIAGLALAVVGFFLTWIDSTLHGTSQFNGNDESLVPIHGFSCGLLVKESKEGITIATDYWWDNEWRNCETIYKKQITSIAIKEISIQGHKIKRK